MKILNILRHFFSNRGFSFSAILCLALIVLITQCVLEYGPSWKESNRISKQISLFKDYWEKEGAQKFQSVGLAPTEKLYQEELNEYLKKYNEKTPTLVPDKRVQEMKQEFQKWWETGGSRSFAVKNIVPDQRLYKKEEAKLLKSYTDTKNVYRIRLNTQAPEPSQVFLHWLLFPNIWMFLIQFASLLFVAKLTEERFGKWINLGLLFLATILGALLLLILSGTSFFANNTSFYTGFMIGTALLLGSICQNKNGFISEKKVIVFASLLLFLNLLITWVTCSQIYVAAIILSLVFFVGGSFLGKYMPLPKKSKKEIEKEKRLQKAKEPKQNFQEVRKKKTRAMLDEGFSCAMRGDFALAGKFLTDAMHALLLESDVDSETLNDIAKKITNPSLYIEVSNTQWQEWGTSAYQKKHYEAALLLLEKSLISEKDEKMARKALFTIGEIRVSQNLNPEEGIKRLQKVLELNDSDIFALQAKKLLQKFSNHSPK